MSEGGLGSAPEAARLRQWATQAEALGLTSCSRPLLRLVEQLEQVRKSVQAKTTPAAETLWHAYHLIRLALSQQALALATAMLVDNHHLAWKAETQCLT